MTTTAADILFDSLLDWGVEVIFGLPGDGINGIMESLRRRMEKIRFRSGTKKLPPLWLAVMRSTPAS